MLTSAPPRSRPGPVIALAAALVTGCTLLMVRDPHVPGSYGACPSLLLGVACPGCGGLRATSELLHGEWGAAWAYNPIVFLALPAAIALILRWGLDAAAHRPAWAPSLRLIAVVFISVAAYGIARNIPLLTPFLGPAAVP